MRPLETTPAQQAIAHALPSDSPLSTKLAWLDALDHPQWPSPATATLSPAKCEAWRSWGETQLGQPIDTARALSAWHQLGAAPIVSHWETVPDKRQPLASSRFSRLAAVTESLSPITWMTWSAWVGAAAVVAHAPTGDMPHMALISLSWAATCTVSLKAPAILARAQAGWFNHSQALRVNSWSLIWMPIFFPLVVLSTAQLFFVNQPKAMGVAICVASLFTALSLLMGTCQTAASGATLLNWKDISVTDSWKNWRARRSALKNKLNTNPS